MNPSDVRVIAVLRGADDHVVGGDFLDLGQLSGPLSPGTRIKVSSTAVATTAPALVADIVAYPLAGG